MTIGTKEKILREAQRLIHTNGFRATSVDAIANAAGVKKANVFYYFPNKEALGLELLDRMTTYLINQVLTPLFVTDRHPTEQIRKNIQGIRSNLEAFNCEGGCPLGNMALEMADVDEAFRTRLTQFFEAWESVIEGGLRRGLETGVYGEAMDPRATASFIVSALEGAILLAKTKRDPKVLAYAESHLMHLLEGYQV